jgi:hypothetical protein
MIGAGLRESGSMLREVRQIATSVDDTQDQGVPTFDPVQDYVAADGEATEVRAEVIAMPAGVRILAEQREPIGYRSIDRSAISMLPVSRKTQYAMSSRSASACGARRWAISEAG